MIQNFFHVSHSSERPSTATTSLKMDANHTSRSFCFTINMKIDEGIDDFKLIRPADDPCIKYLVMQMEQAPTTNQVHWQGYVQFKQPKRWNYVKKLFKRNDTHIEVAKGTIQQNKKYCTKQETRFPGIDPIEIGTCEDKRVNKHTEVLETLRTKGKQATIEKHAEYMMSHGKSFEYFCNMSARAAITNLPQDRLLIYVHGITGTGKTWSIVNAFDEEVYRMPQPDNKKVWMDHYDPQENHVLFLDEFNAEKWDLDYLKEFLDVYPMQPHTKGGFTKTNWKVCFVCSNIRFDNQAWGTCRAQFERRFHTVLHDVNSTWLGDMFNDLYPNFITRTNEAYANWYLPRNHSFLSYTLFKHTPPKWYEQMEPRKRVAFDDDVPPLKRQAAMIELLDPNGDGDPID